MKSLHTLLAAGYLAIMFLGACVSIGSASDQNFKGRLSTWDNLKSLKPGQEIVVIMTNFKRYQGEFESLNDGGIKVRQKARERTLAREDILRVSQEIGQDHSTRNTLIGIAVGGTAGLATGLVANHVIWSHVNCDEGPRFGCSGPPNPHWSIILTPLGALGGAAIGTVSTRAWHDLYRAR